MVEKTKLEDLTADEIEQLHASSAKQRVMARNTVE